MNKIVIATLTTMVVFVGTSVSSANAWSIKKPLNFNHEVHHIDQELKKTEKTVLKEACVGAGAYVGTQMGVGPVGGAALADQACH